MASITESLKKLSRRDRIALGAALGAGALFLIMNYGVLPLLDQVGASPDAVQQKETQLRKEKRLFADENFERAHLNAARGRLKDLETGLLESSSPTLANAEWQRLVTQVAESKGIQLGSSEFLRDQDIGGGYSLVTGRATFRCRVNELVDFLAGLAAFPKLLSVSGLGVFASQGDPQGRMNVQITIGAATRTVKQAKDQAAAH